MKPEDPYIGSVLNGRFTIEAKLGEGGFGAVYRGVQNATGRKVAIKLLHPEMTRDQNVLARFRREGQVLCALRDAQRGGLLRQPALRGRDVRLRPGRRGV